MSAPPRVPQDIIDWGEAPPGYFYNAFGQLMREEAHVFDTSGKQVSYVASPTGVYSPQLNPSETNIRQIQTAAAFKPARITVAAGAPPITLRTFSSPDELAAVAPYIRDIKDAEELPTTRLTEAQIKPKTGLPSWYESGIIPARDVGITKQPEMRAVSSPQVLLQTSAQTSMPKSSTSSEHILERVDKVFSPTGVYLGDALIDRSGGAYAYRDITGTYSSPPSSWGSGVGRSSASQLNAAAAAAIPQPSSTRMTSMADGKIDIRLSQADILRMKQGEELYFSLGNNGFDITTAPVSGNTNLSLRHQDIDWSKSSIVIDGNKQSVAFDTNKGNFTLIDPNTTTETIINRIDYGHKGKTNKDAGFYRAFYEPLGINEAYDKADAEREKILVDYGKYVRDATQQQTDYNAAALAAQASAYGQYQDQIQLAKDLGYKIDINPNTGAVNLTPPSPAEMYIRANLIEQGTPFRGLISPSAGYKPAAGTESFVNAGPNKWGSNPVLVGTGNVTHPLVNQTDYGSLYQTDKGAWYVITPPGQIPQSGSSGAPMGILDERSPMGSLIYNATASQIGIMDKMKQNASMYIGARRQKYNEPRTKTSRRPSNRNNKPKKQPASRSTGLIYPIPNLNPFAVKKEQVQKKRQTKKKRNASGTKIEDRMSRNVSKFLGW